MPVQAHLPTRCLQAGHPGANLELHGGSGRGRLSSACSPQDPQLQGLAPGRGAPPWHAGVHSGQDHQSQPRCPAEQRPPPRAPKQKDTVGSHPAPEVRAVQQDHAAARGHQRRPAQMRQRPGCEELQLPRGPGLQHPRGLGGGGIRGRFRERLEDREGRRLRRPRVRHDGVHGSRPRGHARGHHRPRLPGSSPQAVHAPSQRASCGPRSAVRCWRKSQCSEACVTESSGPGRTSPCGPRLGTRHPRTLSGRPGTHPSRGRVPHSRAMLDRRAQSGTDVTDG
ncbi:PREDICTED: methenyltetrahydrofolate synthase domain-containing protein isoform X6 [Chinchilla lanigera]|uniref:methenyltetrahydrofolate synthase domain-containing protein isoform X6 n=1 Tax=Chinchilla lanigera TaxID=34839 RepID=UPI00069839FB|nr:PREDICTED: methenyltetrahydrofolate synthase domain-containing protein isoform X6 [Chinchilla lanigera]